MRLGKISYRLPFSVFTTLGMILLAWLLGRCRQRKGGGTARQACRVS